MVSLPHHRQLRQVAGGLLMLASETLLVIEIAKLLPADRYTINFLAIATADLDPG